jgi:hypothetical protein
MLAMVISGKDVPFKSIKEYWSDPDRNRRSGSGGRRESDYAVCVFHDQKESSDEAHRAAACKKILALKVDTENDFSSLKKEHNEDIGAVHKRIDIVDGRIIGRWPFGIIVLIFILLVGMVSVSNHFLMSKIVKDIDDLQDNVTAIMVTHGIEKTKNK